MVDEQLAHANGTEEDEQLAKERVDYTIAATGARGTVATKCTTLGTWPEPKWLEPKWLEPKLLRTETQGPSINFTRVEATGTQPRPKGFLYQSPPPGPRGPQIRSNT